MKKQKRIRIGTFIVGEGRPVFIIAEAGVNHNGSIALAKKLVDVAKEAGADAVKFQNFTAEEVTTADAGMAEYQKRNTGKSESQIEMIRKFELPASAFKEISAYCKKRGIMFLSAPHGGFASVDVLKNLNVPAYKFGSADLNNLPVLAYTARFKKPLIISTGMADMRSIAEAVQTIRKAGNDKIVIFHCTTDYPTRLEDVNMRAMQTIRDTFNVVVGYSDHTVGDEASIIAVALGANVLEKHLTLDNSMTGPDHKASANPEDFRNYVQAIRDAEMMLGSSKKMIVKAARQYMPLVLKSVVARGHIKRGERLTRENLAIKRPAGGLPPKFYFDMLGKRATKDLRPDQFIRRGDYAK
ncbi:MAG: N-acetylneuraminate synthase [Patescibacteria group bacterium]